MVQFWTANYLRVANHQRGTQEFTGRLSAQELICHALKPNSFVGFTQTLEKKIIPLFRKQKGF
jgi:hypothetical protein